MGVERAVTLWYVQRQSILNDIALLETRIAEIEVAALVSGILVSDETSGDSVIRETSVVSSEETSHIEKSELEKQLEQVQKKLRTLGPCPKPMMG